jgi:glutamate dehydrogenase
MTDPHLNHITHKLVYQVAKSEAVPRVPLPRSTHFSVPDTGNGNSTGSQDLPPLDMRHLNSRARKNRCCVASAVRISVTPGLTADSEGKVTTCSWIPEQLLDEQIEWFYNMLGIDNAYFELESVDAIARTVTSLYAAKITAFAREDKQEIRLDVEAPDRFCALRPSHQNKGSAGHAANMSILSSITSQ